MAGKSAPKRKPSALKRARQAVKKNLRNRNVISALKTLLKKVEEALSAKDRSQVEKALKEAVKNIGSAVTKGVIHKNTAARKISRLSKKANAMLKTQAA